MARAKPELRPCGIVPDLGFNPSRSLPFFRQNLQSGRNAFSISIRVTPQSLQHYRQIGNCQKQSGHIDPGKSASVYECGRFTCTIKQHLGQMPPKHVAGLPTQVVNDNGRYRQERLMMKVFWQRPCPQRCAYPISTRNAILKTLGKGHLELLKQTSSITKTVGSSCLGELAGNSSDFAQGSV